VRNIAQFRSPRLSIRFEMRSPEIAVFGPNDEPFRTFEGTIDLLEQTTEQLNQERTARQRMGELSRKARSGAIAPDELAELERLESANGSA